LQDVIGRNAKMRNVSKNCRYCSDIGQILQIGIKIIHNQKNVSGADSGRMRLLLLAVC
jgi:hypothetical protein